MFEMAARPWSASLGRDKSLLKLARSASLGRPLKLPRMESRAKTMRKRIVRATPCSEHFVQFVDVASPDMFRSASVYDNAMHSSVVAASHSSGYKARVNASNGHVFPNYALPKGVLTGFQSISAACAGCRSQEPPSLVPRPKVKIQK